jgi:hypothetical protein
MFCGGCRKICLTFFSFVAVTDENHVGRRQIAALSYLTLYVAAVLTAWSLLSLYRNRKTALYLFQKHLLGWANINSFSHCGRF